MRLIEAVTIQQDLDPFLSLKGLVGHLCHFLGSHRLGVPGQESPFATMVPRQPAGAAARSPRCC